MGVRRRSVAVSIPDLTDSDTQVGGAAACGFTIKRDGTTTRLIAGAHTDWANPKNGTVGDAFWVRVTPTSGTMSSGTTSSWLQLNSDRLWTVSRAVVGTKTCVCTIQIATDAAGSNIVATRAGVTLSATVT